MAEKADEVYLRLNMCKALTRDADGNVLFTVEASNENLDLMGQRVQQKALLDSKKYFLQSGVVSKDHKHRNRTPDGSLEYDEEYVIGKPLDIYARGKSTFVKGKLFAKNKHAKKFIELLDQNAGVVKASVGGLMPRIKYIREGGRKIGNVVSVLLDDLALTIAPVNYTVTPATSVMAKALTGKEFVKALTAGHCTDSAKFTGGRALIKEDVSGEAVSSIVKILRDAVTRGIIKEIADAEKLLVQYGVSENAAHKIACKVLKKSVGEELKMGYMEQARKLLLKAVGRKKQEDIVMGKNKEFRDTELDEEDEDEYEDEIEEEDEDVIEDEDADEDEDVTDVIKSLVHSVKVLTKSVTTMQKKLERNDRLIKDMKKSLSCGMLGVIESTSSALKAPMPRQSVVSDTGNKKPNESKLKIRPFTEKSIVNFRPILNKAVADGEIDILTGARYEREMNRSRDNFAYRFSDDFEDFIRTKLSA